MYCLGAGQPVVQQVYLASGQFYSAQVAFTKAVSTGRSPSEVKAAAQTALEAVKPYEDALEALLHHLLTAKAARHKDEEVMRTLRLLALLSREELCMSLAQRPETMKSM